MDNIKAKVKKEFKITERDYLNEYHTFGYVYELVDFIMGKCSKKYDKLIDEARDIWNNGKDYIDTQKLLDYIEKLAGEKKSDENG